MRLFVAVGLLAAIAASVLLGLATFGVPVNPHFWLLRAQAPRLDLKLGALGYRLNGQDSGTGVGYDVPSQLGDMSSDVSNFVRVLTHVLVLFPISFGLACLTALLSFLAFIRVAAIGMLTAVCALLGALVATVAFAILIAIRFELHNALNDASRVDFDYGQAFIFSVVAAACLYLSAILLFVGACCSIFIPRRKRKTRASAAPAAAPRSASSSFDPASQPYESEQAERVRYATPTQEMASEEDLPKFPEHEQALNETYMNDAYTAGQPTEFQPLTVGSAYENDTYGRMSYPERLAYLESAKEDESHELSTWPSRRSAGAAITSQANLLEDSTAASHSCISHPDTEWYTARQSCITPSTSYAQIDGYSDGRTTTTHNTHNTQNNMQHMTQQQAAAWYLTTENPYAATR